MYEITFRLGENQSHLQMTRLIRSDFLGSGVQTKIFEVRIVRLIIYYTAVTTLSPFRTK